MSKRLRVAIVGYGTAGQTAALMLSADEHEVDVFERVAKPGPVGAGFLLQPIGLWVLRQLGLLDGAVKHGAPIRRLYGQTTRGQPVMDMRYGELDPRLFGLGLQRGALFQLLDEAWQRRGVLRCGHAIVELDADAGTLTDAAGRTYAGYDLIVVADGSASNLRGQVAPARLDRPYPWGAQWCLVQAGEWAWSNELQQRYVGARRMAGMLPVGTRLGDPVPRLSFFWSTPTAALPAEGVDPAHWRGHVADVWPEAAERLQETVIPDGLACARYRDTMHRHLHRGRAVLMGDAAHAMSPQLGQGVNMALLDAMVLRDALRETPCIAQALPLYQRQRRRHVGVYHFWSRWLTPLFQSERDFAAKARDLMFHPLSRMPGGRGHMLRVLTGTRRGWLGTLPLPAAFLDVLEQCIDFQ